MTAMPKSDDLTDDSQALCSHAASAVSHQVDGATTDIVWQVPDEVPVAIQINSKPFTVMMATPADLRDFAVGLLVGEGVVSDAAAIQGVLVMPVDGGIALDIAVADDDLNHDRIGARSIEGRTGCGLCGVEDIASAVRPLNPVAENIPPPSAAIIRRAASAMRAAQPMNLLNHSVHGAAFVSNDGDILLLREDVGRHNALDKLVGAVLRSDQNPKDGFVLMTSRCSYELVQKCVTAGFTALVTVSAPTTLALEIAKAANLFLAALGPKESVVIFQS